VHFEQELGLPAAKVAAVNFFVLQACTSGEVAVEQAGSCAVLCSLIQSFAVLREAVALHLLEALEEVRHEDLRLGIALCLSDGVVFLGHPAWRFVHDLCSSLEEGL
jgi:hypothetical protein